MNDITIDVIKSNWKSGAYKNKLPYPNKTKYKEWHVFDENKTVKWNKEEVVRQNVIIDEEKEQYQKESNYWQCQLNDDVIKALVNSYDFNKAQAEKIWNFAYNEKHGNMNDVFYYVEEIADFIESVMQLSEEVK